MFKKNKNDRFYNITDSTSSVSSLRIMSWNFSFAYGVGSAGLNYYQKTKYHFLEALDDAVKLIKDNQVDIVLLQEVDFFCKKSHYIDQLEYLALKLNFNLAYATTWTSAYVPFPFFTPEDHFGQTNAGGGILSRFPITSNTVKLLPKPTENFKIYNYFYPARYLQTISVSINNNNYQFGNLHLEAFSINNRKIQSDILANEISMSQLDCFGGDFNTIPLVATKRSHFKDYETDSYVDDNTLSIFNELDYNEICPEQEYLENEESWFTFPSNAPDRRLDYLFYNSKFKLRNRKVIKSKISDHFAIMATFIMD